MLVVPQEVARLQVALRVHSVATLLPPEVLETILVSVNPVDLSRFVTVQLTFCPLLKAILLSVIVTGVAVPVRTQTQLTIS